jgi:fibrobacter succinogenes major domain (fib_succ_major)
MKNIRKYMMAAVCMAAASALAACTEAVKRDAEQEIQEMTVPKKPGPITKVPATLTCNGGEEFTFSVSKVQWAETYEWTIADQEKSKISIVDGQGTNVITVKVVNDDVVIPAQSVSVVAKNELGSSSVREYFAAITVSVPIELPGYTIKKYGKRWWMTEDCHEAGEDGNLGVAPDLTAFSVAGLEASHLQRLNDAKGRYYTWYEAMTGISGCTPEQCPYVPGYEGTDDAGNPFRLDGTEEGEFGVQIRGCCPEGWHVANANDWWDMLMAIKSEFAIPDDFTLGGYTFSGGHDKKPENAATKASFYKSGCTVKNMGNVGAWLRGGNGRIVDGGIWNQANLTLSDAGEALLQFVDGAESVGFGWWPVGYQKNTGAFDSGSLGKWGHLWFIGQTSETVARTLVISGTSMNLVTKANTDATKTHAVAVRCVKNYTK